MQCHQRDQRSQAFSVGFRPCRLRAEISPDSLNLLMILWTIYDEIPKFLAIVHWETLFLNCSTICSRSCSKWWTSPHSCLWMTEPFRDALFIPNHSTKLFTINLFTCGMFQTGVWWAFLNFLSIFCHLSQLLCHVLLPSNSKVNDYLQKTIKFISLNIKYLVFVVYSIEYRLKRICKSLYSVFIYV